MATEEEIEDIVDEFAEQIGEIADDSARFSQQESLNIYDGIASMCQMRANALRQEIG